MLDREYTKDQILERYLNTVFFGNNAYGIQAAAETYFGKTADQLTFIEAAFLAGLVRSPSGYDPINNPERSRGRFIQVLDRLVEDGYITAEEATALGTDFVLPERTQSIAGQANLRTYYTEALRDYLLNKSNILGTTYAERYNTLFRGGLRIHTTFNPVYQLQAEQARNVLPDNAQGFDAAVVSLDTATGRDPGDGRRPRLRAQRARGQHGPAAAPDGVEHQAVRPRRRAPGRRPGRRHHRRRQQLHVRRPRPAAVRDQGRHVAGRPTRWPR